jgi:hypothetical protein
MSFGRNFTWTANVSLPPRCFKEKENNIKKTLLLQVLKILQLAAVFSGDRFH